MVAIVRFLSKRTREEHKHMHSCYHRLHQHPYRKHPGARDGRENRKIGKNKGSLGHVNGSSPQEAHTP